MDQQIIERQKVKDKLAREKVEYDKSVIAQDQADLEKERIRKANLLQKVMDQKRMRDQMVTEAAKRKQDKDLSAKKDEREQARQLQADIQNEKQAKKLKRDQEREQARQVIAENELEKRKRLN